MFIPLKTAYFNHFACGEKKEEFRIYGKRWNEKVCYIKRQVILSKGYSGARLRGEIVSFRVCLASDIKEIIELFPALPSDTKVACIGIHIFPISVIQIPLLFNDQSISNAKATLESTGEEFPRVSVD